MPIITLTSDWGLKDPYLASVKGVLLSQIPDVRIIDVSHEIPPFDINQASFIIRNSYRSFPDGTVHIIALNSEASIETPHMVMKLDNQYFIGADTGIFNLITEGREVEKIIELEIMQDTDIFTFSTRDVFVKAAVHIIQGKSIEELGSARNEFNQRISFKPVIDGKVIRGKVIYVDTYENLITNITREHFRNMGKGSRFEITFRTPGYTIRKLSDSYSDVPEGEMLALIGSTGYLEIAINKGNAGSLLGMGMDDTVRVEFS